jgi:hypothetical protein
VTCVTTVMLSKTAIVAKTMLVHKTASSAAAGFTVTIVTNV